MVRGGVRDGRRRGVGVGSSEIVEVEPLSVDGTDVHRRHRAGDLAVFQVAGGLSPVQLVAKRTAVLDPRSFFLSGLERPD